MPLRFFTLRNPFRIVDDVPQWILDFPAWIDNEAFDFRDSELLRHHWNPDVFAFATVAPPGSIREA